MSKNIDLKTINNIKALSIDQIKTANSGHPGIALGAAPILYNLYLNHLNIEASNPNWINRDRFVLSAGHGSALLYSILFAAGYDLEISDLKKFRSLNSKTPGHPEYKITKGVEATTGPLGQGFANAVGIAISEAYLSDMFDKIFDYNTYVLCSDGDLMEGISYEAASLAGTLKLGKLIVLYDSNNISLDGKLGKSFTEDTLKRFSSMGWHVQTVKNVNNLKSLDTAINKAKLVKTKPSLIEIKTIIGKDSLLQGTSKVHGAPLSVKDVEQLYKKLGISEEFQANETLFKRFRKKINKRVKAKEIVWKDKYEKYLEKISLEKKNTLENFVNNSIKYNVFDLLNVKEIKDKSLREVNGIILNKLAEKYFTIIGGSADLSSSNKTYLNKLGDFSSLNKSGRNIWFGVREHSMGAIINGMALSGLRPFGATFLSFSDYLKPTIRLSAIMDIPSVFIFTHDSISVGEDGPTHQPVEQLSMLRGIPNLFTYRPADGIELAAAWDNILRSNKPSAIVMSRNEGKLLKNTSETGASKGAYIIKKENNILDAILIATGSEVKQALEISDNLEDLGVSVRVVSMPCVELFLGQTNDYKLSVLPSKKNTFIIEKSNDYRLLQFTDCTSNLFFVDSFGNSGSAEDIEKDMMLDTISIQNKICNLIK